MNNKNISTRSGILLIAIITVFVAVLVLKYAENSQVVQVSDDKISKQQSKEQHLQTQEKNQNLNVNQNITVTISEPIEQWKTCHNIGGAYEIKYPSAWVLGLRGPYGYERLEGCTSSRMLFNENVNSEKSISLGIDVQDTYKGTGFIFEGSKSLDDYFEKSPEVIQSSPIIKETIIANERAVFLEDFPNPRVLIYHHDRIFEIFGADISEKVFTDIFSTFKFLK